MRGLELVVVLGVAVLLCSLLARRFGVTPPVLLFGCGVLLGFIPALHRAHLPPEAMLFLFLPALLYWESLTTRWGDPGPGSAFLRAGEEQPDEAVGVRYVLGGERVDVVGPAVDLRSALGRGAGEHKSADQPWADEGQFLADVAAE
jgi:hypothetical protein